MARGCHCRVQWTWCHCWVPSQGATVVCYGGGRRGTTNFGGVDVVPLLGAIVLWWGEDRVTTKFGGVGVVASLRAIAGCHCGVLWGSGRSAIAGCHCRVPFCSVLWWREGRVTTDFEGVDVVRLLGAIAGSQSLFHVLLLSSGPPISPRQPRKQQ